MLLLPYVSTSLALNAWVGAPRVAPAAAARMVVATPDAAIAALMAQHDPILLFASRLLPPAARCDASALYAWCRRLDEIVDDPSAGVDPAATCVKLDQWSGRFERLCEGHPDDEMDAALFECMRHHPSLERAPFMDMIAGMRSDAVPSRRIASYPELLEYGYRVAGTAAG